ncbi:UNVERIFIED_CONTAM: hypothetical protein Slati_3798400 [Sesamum latifolium]|uniref:Uncharacterized protein n=1 Tax=Sesamum latifolium TaxID=2727402 RepID=A0AAW2U5Y9_9LAMI
MSRKFFDHDVFAEWDAPLSWQSLLSYLFSKLYHFLLQELPDVRELVTLLLPYPQSQ